MQEAQNRFSLYRRYHAVVTDLCRQAGRFRKLKIQSVNIYQVPTLCQEPFLAPGIQRETRYNLCFQVTFPPRFVEHYVAIGIKPKCYRSSDENDELLQIYLCTPSLLLVQTTVITCLS